MIESCCGLDEDECTNMKSAHVIVIDNNQRHSLTAISYMPIIK